MIKKIKSDCSVVCREVKGVKRSRRGAVPGTDQAFVVRMASSGNHLAAHDSARELAATAPPFQEKKIEVWKEGVIV